MEGNTLLQRLLAQASARNIKPLSVQSKEWFRTKIRSSTFVGSENYQKIILNDAQVAKRFTTKMIPGQMYTFIYEAKHDKILPFWDRYPLIFMTDVYADGFLGLNLHYLAPKARAILFDTLLTYAGKDKTRLQPKSRLQISWSILKRASKTSYIQPCVKRYLAPFIKSKIVYIPTNEWEPAIYLPTENFVRATPREVWKASQP